MSGTAQPAHYIEFDEGKAPKGAQFYTLNRDGIDIRFMRAPAQLSLTRTEARGTVLVSPGRTEFIEKYFETLIDLQARGFCVFIVDPRGQGLSSRLLDDPLKGYVENFEDYVDDYVFTKSQFEDQLPEPHILLGHSMGGTIGLLALIERKLRPAAAVFCAPMTALHDLQVPILGSILKWLSCKGFSKRRLPFQNRRHGLPVKFIGNILTTDKGRYERWAHYFRNHEALRVGGPTFGWTCAAMRAMKKVNAQADTIKTPLLIVSAGADPIVSPSSNEALAQNAQGDYMVIPGALHEILLERDEYRDQFWERFDSFLEEQGL